MLRVPRAARRTCGARPVAGFRFLIPGVAFSWRGQFAPPSVLRRPEVRPGIAAVFVALLGLAAFDLVLWYAGDRILSGLWMAT